MMKLYDHLQKAKTEEVVKDIYIRELWLTEVKKGWVDIQTKEIWFEAKLGGDNSCYKMFTQLLHYVHAAFKKGEDVPPLLGVIDQQKAALMKTVDVEELLKKKTIKWGKSASQYSQQAFDEVSQFIGTHFVEYNLETQSDKFIKDFKYAQKHKKFLRTEITPDNLRQVFDRWVEVIGNEIIDIEDKTDYALLFFADIMSDGYIATHDNLPAELLRRSGKPVFSFGGKIHGLRNTDGYQNFWLQYARPPDEEHRDYLLERRDSLIPLDERKFKGAFYTPLKIVNKAYDTLAKTLGANWQKEYIIWDMCCGVGNLEVKHSNYRNIFMSTLDKDDTDMMESAKTCAGAERFQYDYLNDDITDNGKIDYSLTQKVPQKLRDAIKDGKKILVLMNPPYAEASNTSRRDDPDNKEGVAKTKIADVSMQKFGKASNELFTQFLARIAIEIPTATIAMFSKLKYVNAPNFEEFRRNWNAKYLDGFIVRSRMFDGLCGDFPIGFLIWQTHPRKQKEYAIGKISTEILDDKVQPAGRKAFYNLPNEKMLNKWIDRPAKNNTPALPLKNAISPATSKAHLKHWSDGAIAYMSCAGNDFQQATNLTALYSSCFGNGHGFYVTPDNLEKAAMTFTVRRIFTVGHIIEHAWTDDRDQFLIPTGTPPEEFKNDCLIWMLFNGSNLTAGADRLEWNNEKWSLVNHFIPFSEREVKVTKPFESAFMAEYLEDKKLSPEADAVMAEGRKLWKSFFDKPDPHIIREEYKLNRPDVGWHQIRNALAKRNEKTADPKAHLTDFKKSYQILSDKLRPMVFDLGFLPPKN